MNIGGALGVIGDAKLEAYSWGALVVAIVNSHLPAAEQIVLQTTGVVAYEKILGLGSDVTHAILIMDIGPLEGSVALGEHKRFTVKTVVVGLAIVMTIVVLVMSLGIHTATIKSGGNVEADWVEKLVTPLLEILKFLLTAG